MSHGYIRTPTMHLAPPIHYFSDFVMETNPVWVGRTPVAGLFELRDVFNSGGWYVYNQYAGILVKFKV